MPICTCMHVCTSTPSSLTPHNLLSFALPIFLSSGGLPNVQHAMILVNTKLLTICGRFANITYMTVLNLPFCSTNKKAPVRYRYSNNVLCLELSVVLFQVPSSCYSRHLGDDTVCLPPFPGGSSSRWTPYLWRWGSPVHTSTLGHFQSGFEDE